jgi:hypothetical protein
LPFFVSAARSGMRASLATSLEISGCPLRSASAISACERSGSALYWSIRRW